MCGLRPIARQIRDTAVWFSTATFAIDRVNQCVSPFGGGYFTVLALARLTW